MKILALIHRQHGATLIEVLIAVVLLAFALLGIAGLLGNTTRYQVGSEVRSMTALLFNDLTNRMRANPGEIPGYDPNIANPAYAYSQTWATQQGAIGNAAQDCGPRAAATCTSAQRAAYDLLEIRTRVREFMPQGSLSVSGNTTAMTVTFLWFDKDYTEGISPPTLRQSAICNVATPDRLRQSCCPASAAVDATPGVRCLNFSFIP